MLSPGRQRQKQKQIPCGDDNKKGKDNDKSESGTLASLSRWDEPFAF
jgi:hypothetical protein